MFHVLLVLPMLAAFGVAAVFLLAAPFCAGTALALLLGFFGKKRAALLAPAALGAAGLGCSLYYFNPMIPVEGMIIYWALFVLWLWLVWLAVDQIRKAVNRWKEK